MTLLLLAPLPTSYVRPPCQPPTHRRLQRGEPGRRAEGALGHALFMGVTYCPGKPARVQFYF